METAVNVQQYLDRIQYSGEIENTLAVLSDLQQCHLLTVPFENLAIHYGKAIELDVEKIFVKLVENKRGGFCYELNGLFYELLIGLGFNAKRISARVYNDQKKAYGAEFDHMAILVEIGGKEYLTDVGFGEFVSHPLSMETGIVQEDPRGKYIIEPYENGYFQVTKLLEGNFQPQYVFSKKARDLSEFKEMCVYHQTSPDSHFTQKRLISVATKTGRITITGDLLKITENGETILEKQLESEAVFLECLEKYFDVKGL